MADLSGRDSVAPRLSRGPLAEAAKAVQLITAVVVSTLFVGSDRRAHLDPHPQGWRHME